jgi:nuclear GTP-binding protein
LTSVVTTFFFYCYFNQRHYGVKEWTDSTDFMGQLAAQMGRLLKGGEPDVNSIAKIMINDWQRVG